MNSQANQTACSNTASSHLTAITHRFSASTPRRQEVADRISHLLNALRGEVVSASQGKVGESVYPPPSAGSLQMLSAIVSHHERIDDDLELMLSELESLLSS